ncbi:DUF3784 domain-containing protein [Macrococcus equipercicus]|uniref:DUF3784 domain-containing protein n=1 Tax=Macrococcus equipercicus TaxID=69967 RepID=A0ABQ6R6J1_9STAP|nr:DUF3784 domain-containing protein [Macrococcus equipercicus]
MPLILIIIILLFLIPLAVMFSMEKGAMLIAGYNTMSKDQQSQYDEKKLWASLRRHGKINPTGMMKESLRHIDTAMAIHICTSIKIRNCLRCRIMIKS